MKNLPLDFKNLIPWPGHEELTDAQSHMHKNFFSKRTLHVNCTETALHG